MDKKIRNRILYVTVAGLWGVAIYRTWKNYEVKEELEITQTMSLPAVSPMQFRKDTFELVLPDKDPFLQKSWVPSANASEVKTNDKPQPVVKKEVVQPVPEKWPAIEYFGFVKNRNQNSTLCLLKIDGKQMQLSKGEKYNGLWVQNTFKDSVQVIFKGELRTIRK